PLPCKRKNRHPHPSFAASSAKSARAASSCRIGADLLRRFTPPLRVGDPPPVFCLPPLPRCSARTRRTAPAVLRTSKAKSGLGEQNGETHQSAAQGPRRGRSDLDENQAFRR